MKTTKKKITAEAKLKQIKQLVEDWEPSLYWKFVALIKNILKE